MALDFGLVLHPWNFSTAAGNLLDRVVGEVGIDHLTVPVVTGALTQLRLACGYDSPFFFTEGGFHFQPDRSLYVASGLRPPVARWCGKRETLEPIRGYCAKRGLDLLFRVNPQAVPELTAQNPELRPRTAWGDEIPPAGPCLCHPAFREFLEATLRDLGRWAPAGMQLAGLQLRAPLPEFALTQLGVPFSTAARQTARRAGVDVAAAEAYVKGSLESLRRQRAVPVTAGDLETRQREFRESPVGVYFAALQDDVGEWLTCVGQSLGGARKYALDPSDLALERLENWLRVSRFIAVGYESMSPQTRREVFGTAHGLSTPLTFQDPHELVRFLQDLRKLGLRFFEFSGLESNPDPDITCLKQAVRYARREAESVV